jgi:DNA-binding MarR family transcriptional regulator
MTLMLVLRRLAAAGSASVQKVAHELGLGKSHDVEVAFTAALAAGLIEAERIERESGHFHYRVTADGARALAEHDLGPESEVARHHRHRTAKIEDVLAVLVDFERFGGASRELVAWELFTGLEQVAMAFEGAIAEGLIERVPGASEETWRLTKHGRAQAEADARADG